MPKIDEGTRIKKSTKSLPIKLLAFLLLLSMFCFTPVHETKAIGLLRNFGGRVVSIVVCTCPFLLGWSVTVVAPPGTPQSSGQFFDMYSPVPTIPYSYYFPTPGSLIKGQAYTSTWIPCLQYTGTACAPGGPGGQLMYQFGTSAK